MERVRHQHRALHREPRPLGGGRHAIRGRRRCEPVHHVPPVHFGTAQALRQFKVMNKNFSEIYNNFSSCRLKGFYSCALACKWWAEDRDPALDDGDLAAGGNGGRDP